MGRREWRPANAQHLGELRAGVDVPSMSAEDLASFAVERFGDGAVVHASGELDMLTTPRLRGLIADLVVERPRVLVLDLAEVSFFASSALATLIEAHAMAGDLGVRLRLAGLGPAVYRPLQITGLADQFDSYDDVPAALSAAGLSCPDGTGPATDPTADRATGRAADPAGDGAGS